MYLKTINALYSSLADTKDGVNREEDNNN